MTTALLPDPAQASLNREVLYADAATPEAVVSAGRALPLFGARRLIVIRGLQDSPARVVDRLRAAIERARAEPGGWPAAETTVAMMAGGVDRRAPVLRLVPAVEQVEVRAPTGRAVVGWLRERAQAAGLEVAPEAAQSLVDLVGEDLGRLTAEIEKAAIYVGGDRRLSEEIVRALAGETRVRQYWELTQALEAGRRADAIRVLDHLLAAGDEPLVVLAWVIGYIRNLWRVLAGLAESVETREIARLLRPARPEWAAERLMARASAVGSAGIRAAVRHCFEVERALKTSAGSPRALLTVLVADLAG